MSWRDQWSAFENVHTGRLWRRYQWFWPFGRCVIPLYDEEYDRGEFVEVTTMADPEHMRVFLHVGHR